MKKLNNAIIKRSLALPVARAHAVVSTRTYLCTDEGMEQGGTSEIFHTDITVDEHGVTHAVVHMRNQQQAAHNVTNPSVETGQAVAVQPLEDDGFTMHSLVSLPQGIGNMRTAMDFRASGDGNTQVTAYVEVDIPATQNAKPAVAKALTKKLLTAAPASVDRGLERIVLLSQRDDLD